MALSILVVLVRLDLDCPIMVLGGSLQEILIATSYILTHGKGINMRMNNLAVMALSRVQGLAHGLECIIARCDGKWLKIECP